MRPPDRKRHLRSWLGCGLVALAWVSGAPGARAEPAATRPLPTLAANGLYPLWEGTGDVHGHRHGVVALRDVQLGLGGWGQLGSQPLEFVFRTPNAQLKLALWRGERWRWALQAGCYALLPGAGEAFLSPTYAATLRNQDFSVFALPLQLATSWRAAPWLQLHHTLTALTVAGQPPVQPRLTVGNFLTAELLALRHHGFYLHLGEVGAWAHELLILGASYRLRWGPVEGRVGYVYRRHAEGWQGQPLIDLGVRF